MSKIQEMMAGIRAFWSEVLGETKRCEWPSKDELVESTTVVVVFLALLTVFIGLSDRLLVVMVEKLVELAQKAG